MLSNKPIPPLPQIDRVVLKSMIEVPEYAIGNDGSVWSCAQPAFYKSDRRWRAKAICGFSEKYLFVSINGRRRSVHHLVLETFVGNRPDGYHGCHNDGNSHNNHLSNLRWDTPKANCADTIEHGRYIAVSSLGEDNGRAKLTDERIHEIRSMLASDVSISYIASCYGVDRTTIRRIRDGLNWTHVAEDKAHVYKRGLRRGVRNPLAKMTEQDVASVRELLRTGVNLTAIGKQFGVSRKTVRSIRDGKTYIT